MPNEAGRQPVGFGLGVSCSTCLGASGHCSRQLAAALSPCKSLNGFTLLLWAVQAQGAEWAWSLSRPRLLACTKPICKIIDTHSAAQGRLNRL